MTQKIVHKLYFLFVFLEHLTSRSLAFGIMDNGQQVERGDVILYTNSCNSLEINISREALS